MSDFFNNNNDSEKSALSDFLKINNANPKTITQAGIDDYDNRFNLKFDGSKLRLMIGDNEVLNWDGVSGEPGYWDPRFQSLKNKGPIPEGYYNVKQDNYVPMSTLDSIIGLAGRGKFPGGTYSWGNSKISLEPRANTNMFSRGGFNIHGGKKKGSKGCIDLTDQNDNFMKVFLTIGEDLPLEVKYENQPKPTANAKE